MPGRVQHCDNKPSAELAAELAASPGPGTAESPAHSDYGNTETCDSGSPPLPPRRLKPGRGGLGRTGARLGLLELMVGRSDPPARGRRLFQVP